MENNIKDYLHLYLGCNYIADYPPNPSSPEVLTGKVYDIIIATTSDHLACNSKYIKPILRPLSDATEEENIQAIKAVLLHTDTWVGGAFRTAYLLSKHFDLFGLIEAGLAIDKTTLKQ